MDFLTPNCNFVGREQELQRIEEILLQNFHVCIVGMPGIGKKELVKAYMRLNKNKYNVIKWINAEVTLDILKNDATESEQEKISLTVIDNGNFEESKPHKSNHKVFIMSFYKSNTTNVKIIELKSFENEEAADFFKHNLSNLLFTSTAVEKISKLLHYYPFALQRFSNFLNTKSAMHLTQCNYLTIEALTGTNNLTEIHTMFFSLPIEKLADLEQYFSNKLAPKAQELSEISEKYHVALKKLIELPKEVALKIFLIFYCIRKSKIEMMNKLYEYLKEIVNNSEYKRILEVVTYLDSYNTEIDLDVPKETLNQLQKCFIVRLKSDLIMVDRVVQECLKVKFINTNDEENILRKLLEKFDRLDSLTNNDYFHLPSIWKEAHKYESLINDYFCKSLYKFPEYSNVTTLHILTRNEMISVIESVFAKINNDQISKLINKSDSNNCTPVHLAAERVGNLLQYFIEMGADVHQIDINGQTMLHRSIQRNNFKNINLLTEKKVDLEVKDNHGYTVLQCAVKRNKSDLLMKLIDSGANVYVVDNETKTLVHLAAEHGNIASMKILNNLDLNINAKDNKLLAPIHYAIQNCHKNVVDYLIKANANVDAEDAEGRSLLQYAIYYDDLCRKGKYLFRGVNLLSTDNRAKKLKSLFEIDSLTIVKILLNTNIDLTKVDKRGQNVLHYITTFDNYDFLLLLKEKMGSKLTKLSAVDENGCKPKQYLSEDSHILKQLQLLERFED